MKKIKKNPWWSLSIDEVAQKIDTDIHQGLSQTEVEQRIKQYGLNKLEEKDIISPFIIFLRQFKSLLVWVLIVTLLITGFLGEWVDSIVIGAIVIFNAFVGFLQEYKAERSLEALHKLTIPKTRVIRDGKQQAIFSDTLVPGDLVVLEAGDIVPADGRIVKLTQLTTQEAALTGESLPVHKIVDTLPQEVPVADQKNMVFMGTNVVKGKGYIIVTETGMMTQLGAIASLLAREEEGKTPLEIRLDQLGHRLIIGCFGIVVIIFVLGLWRGSEPLEMILTSLSLAVAAIPEGLPAVMTVALAAGVQRMIKRKALIRRLSSVETLGRTTVICVDKTGTLTQNEMTVRRMWVGEKVIDVTGVGYKPAGALLCNNVSISPHEFPELQHLLKIGVLCNGALLEKKNDTWEIIGDPTEAALLTVAAKAGIYKNEEEEKAIFIEEIPFSSERQRMSIIREENDKHFIYVKGSPEVIVNLSTHILLNEKVQLFSDDYKNKILNINNDFGKQALRVLAFAYREIDENEHYDETIEKDLIFVGLAGMIDPPRPEVKQSIETCKRAGIKTVMITGDQKETAIAIAQELGLKSDGLAVTGTELRAMSDDQLYNSIHQIAIYARVVPEDKIRIVQAFKVHGDIVAMTGDGVNDAPAIKAADIGIAMGITGTQVSKEASDMVIMDDNFATIVNAVEEGRGIFDNIIKFVNYLLSSNIAELIIIFLGSFLGFIDPKGRPYISLLPIHLLWINLVTDGFPALALSLDPYDPHIMKQKPKKPTESILSPRFTLNLFVIALIMAIGTLFACHFGLQTSAKLGHTMAFTSLVILELVRVQIIRAQYHIGLFSNYWLFLALAISFFLQLIVIYVPGLQKVFRTTHLTIVEWGVILFIVICVWIISWLVQRFFFKETH